MTKTREDVLLTPGPTPVHPEARHVMAEPIFHHRTPRFQKLFAEVTKSLQVVFRTKRSVYTLAASGTGAMEAAMVNFLSAGDEVLTVECGKFGERWTHLANAYGLKAHVLKSEWGKTVSPQTVKAALEEYPKVKAVYTTLCETSTGVVEDIAAYGKITAKHSALLVVDAISGLGADRLEMDSWGVDVVVSGSQKGLMIPPGLGFIAISGKAERQEAQASLPKFYFDISLCRTALAKGDTPFTPAIGLITALQKALEAMVEEGYDNVIARHEKLAFATRAGVKAMGLRLFAESPANAVTSVHSPEGVDSKKLVKYMRDELGVAMAGGQAELAGKIFRFAHLGYIRNDDLIAGFHALDQGLAYLGYKIEAGKGARAFTKAMKQQKN